MRNTEACAAVDAAIVGHTTQKRREKRLCIQLDAR